jgi:hypothetical protein
MTAQQIQQIARYKQKIKDLISIIRYQEGYIDKLDETYCSFYNQYIELVKLITLDRTHYNEQSLYSLQKLQNHLKQIKRI